MPNPMFDRHPGHLQEPVIANALPNGHPIRELLQVATEGHTPTAGHYERLKEWDAKLPPGEGLSGHTQKTQRAAEEILAEQRHRGNGAARRVYEAQCNDIAGHLSEAALAVRGDVNPEPLSDIANRMFSR